ncbi:MAG: squalene/phytoene synthase family protein [Gemmatimonadaceae bacterium]
MPRLELMQQPRPERAVRDDLVERLHDVCARKLEEGSPRIALAGQLLRPMLALAGAAPEVAETDEFMCGILAVQLAHEASLAHDDVVDRATIRRGAPSVFAEKGVAGALLEGDHLLTAAFRLAASTGSTLFVQQFARAVERTVAAEKMQGRLLGETLDEATCERIAAGKTGELIACALATGALIQASAEASAVADLGREIGVLYQMLDDLLDYCRAAKTGKPFLGDFAQRHWTWVLGNIPGAHFGMRAPDVLSALHEPRAEWGSASAFDRMCVLLEDRVAALRERCAQKIGLDTCAQSLLDGWSERISVARESERRDRSALVYRAIERRVAATMGDAHNYSSFLSRNAVSFRFASRLLPEAEFATIVRVYAFCRLTDNIVDDPAFEMTLDNEIVAPGAAETLSRWLGLARASYGGEPSGLPIIDGAMQEMAASRVPFDYVEDMARAMRMDIAGKRYETLAELREYTYGVAGVVGLWLARLGGVQDSRGLANAERMGHAMQLTNIIRDVGEDWLNNRCYIPAAVLRDHGLRAEDINVMLSGGREISVSYRVMIEEMIGVADEYYRDAFESIPALSRGLQRCMAVAARVYRGIHQCVRANEYDNLHRRARTSLIFKMRLAIGGLVALRAATRHAPNPATLLSRETIPGWSEGRG